MQLDAEAHSVVRRVHPFPPKAPYQSINQFLCTEQARYDGIFMIWLTRCRHSNFPSCTNPHLPCTACSLSSDIELTPRGDPTSNTSLGSLMRKQTFHSIYTIPDALLHTTFSSQLACTIHANNASSHNQHYRLGSLS